MLSYTAIYSPIVKVNISAIHDSVLRLKLWAWDIKIATMLICPNVSYFDGYPGTHFFGPAYLSNPIWPVTGYSGTRKSSTSFISKSVTNEQSFHRNSSRSLGDMLISVSFSNQINMYWYTNNYCTQLFGSYCTIITVTYYTIITYNNTKIQINTVNFISCVGPSKMGLL